MSSIANFNELFGPFNSLWKQLDISNQQHRLLVTYLERLWVANQSLNLFSRKLSPKALLTNHLLDCLIGLPYFPAAKLAADLGSGGGLPAIPIAVCRPQTKLILFEKSPRKRQFLASLSDLCPNIEIQGLIEPGSLGREIAWVTARAFKPIPVILEITRAYANRGGHYLLYKGRLAKIEAELGEAKLGKLKSTIHGLPQIGEAQERHLVALHP